MIIEYLLWMIIYSFIGWVYESILCSFTEKRWVNRGFLNGPYCPIYGSGAILCLLLFDGISNPIVIFYFGMVTACTLEYFTSWLMEKLFQARWWDYSGHRYNLNGRICLLGAFVFGTFSVLLIQVIHPKVSTLTDVLSDNELFWIAVLLLVGVSVDGIVTIMSMKGFNKKLELAEIKIQFMELKQQIAEIKSIVLKLNLQERRILRAFPKLKSNLYDNALQFIKEGLLKLQLEQRHKTIIKKIKK